MAASRLDMFWAEATDVNAATERANKSARESLFAYLMIQLHCCFDFIPCNTFCIGFIRTILNRAFNTVGEPISLGKLTGQYRPESVIRLLFRSAPASFQCLIGNIVSDKVFLVRGRKKISMFCFLMFMECPLS